VGQVRLGRITRLAEFGAFVELEPGIEALAHASTFAPTGQPGGWARTVSVGMTGGFEILSLDLGKKRIGVALVLEAASEAGAAAGPSPDEELRDYKARADAESSQGFGSLADKLRGALEPRRK
jgi:small subunit ribosomal protein S1